MNTFNALIIGAGNIGAFYDTPDTQDILTHAHAFSSYNNINLIGFVDTDLQKAQKAASIWNTSAFNSIDAAMDSGKINIVAVAVPDDYHYSVLKDLQNFDIDIILAEKPLVKTIEEAKDILENFKIPILVNYSRRFVPEFINLKQQIQKGVFGYFLGGSGIYGKGLLHNGSHMLDLIRYLICDINDFNVLNSINDFYQDDPSIETILKLSNNSNFYLNIVDSSCYTIFEADFIFEKARVKMLDSGFKLEIYQLQNSNVFQGYKYLEKQRDINTQLSKAMYFTVDNIYKYLSGKESILCNVQDAYRVMEICTQITEKTKKY